jgi:hypothetical protein
MELGVVPGGEWCVNANELLSNLQRGYSAIDGELPSLFSWLEPAKAHKCLGAAKLSYPDPTSPEYNKYFVQAASREALASATTSPSTIVIPSSGTIKIFVDSVCINFFPCLVYTD